MDGGRQRCGKLNKQGSPLVRFLWCEAAGHAVCRDEQLKRFYRRKLAQKGMGKAKVAAGRKLGVRLWIMLRDNIDYQRVLPSWTAGTGNPGGDAC